MLNDLLAKNQSSDKLYVEDVFSTYLYNGTGATRTVTNNIDISSKGGMVWIKCRNSPDGTNPYHVVGDTTMNLANGVLATNSSGPQGETFVGSSGLSGFTTSGFSITDGYYRDNAANGQYASWAFRKQPKFFDVVTWTGNGSNRTISHNLGVVPGMIIVKRTDSAADWQVYHRSLANTEYAVLNTTAAKATGATRWNSTTATDTVFSLGTDSTVNATGGSYVAYIFAHDTTADGVIQCGSFTASGSEDVNVNLGWEPQYVLIKRISTTGDWRVFDNMRGLYNVSAETGLGTTAKQLLCNTSAAETSDQYVGISATGFNAAFSSGAGTYIYLAIRRGPMRTPTDATKVFSPILQNASQGTKATTGFAVDMQIETYKTGGRHFINDRLRGVSSTSTGAVVALDTTDTGAESTDSGLSAGTRGWDNTGFQQPFYYDASNAIFWNFARAPGFFDVVCYTGNQTARTINHNLGVVPELIITKNRSTSGNAYWAVYSPAPGTLELSSTRAASSAKWGITGGTATTFSLDTDQTTNQTGITFVAYLFASCPGVSKVGSYTGTGATKQIDCGFTNGARFVLIKRTDSTGDWYVYDSARGIVSGNDPYLLLNSTAAEVTNTDYIDPLSTGFELSSTAPAGLNANGGTYIYLAIA